MGLRFDRLSQPEKAAVTAYLHDKYARLLHEEPATDISRHAQKNPYAWYEGMRELIAGDPKRVQAILSERNGM